MAEFCRECFIHHLAPSKYDIDHIVMSEDEDVCEGCMKWGKYVDHIDYSERKENEDTKDPESIAQKYKIILYWSKEDNAYITEVPDLPGCMSDGKTKEEAIQNTRQIILEWIELATELGRPIPIPHYSDDNFEKEIISECRGLGMSDIEIHEWMQEI